MIPHDLTYFNALLSLGASGWGVALVLLAFGIVSTVFVFESLVLRRRWHLRHTVWSGIVAPLLISAVAVAVTLDRFWTWAAEPFERERGIRLIAASRIFLALGLIDATIGCAVHVLNRRRDSDASTTPNDRNA